MSSSSLNPRKRSLSIAVIGDRGSGKSTFVSQAILRTKPHQHIKTTTAQSFQKEIFLDIDGFRRPIQLRVWDTPGSRRHPDHTCPLTECRFLQEVDAVIITFDCTRRSAFDSLCWWFERVAPICLNKQIHKQTFPVILVGTKADLFLPNDQTPARQGRLLKSRSVQLTAPLFAINSSRNDVPDEKMVEANLLSSASLSLPPSAQRRSPSPHSSTSLDEFIDLKRKVLEWCNSRPHFDLFYKFTNVLFLEQVSDMMDLIVEQFTEDFMSTSAHADSMAFVNTARRVQPMETVDMDDDETELWSDGDESDRDEIMTIDLESLVRPRSASDTIDRSRLIRHENRSIVPDLTVRAPLWVKALVEEE